MPRSRLLLVVFVTVLVAGLIPVPTMAQKPPPPPPGAVTALMHCAPWQPDAVPTSTISPPTGLHAEVQVPERGVVRLSWQDNADTETCYALLRTLPPETALPPALRTAVAVVSLPNATEATVFVASPGPACFQVYAGNAAGRSALSNMVCVDPLAAPAPPASPPPLPQPPANRPPPARDAPLVTGIPEVDAVIEAMRMGDIEELVAQVHFTDLECISEPQGIGSPPLCSALGLPRGSVVALLPLIGSHLEYRPWWEAPEVFRSWVERSRLVFAGVLDPAHRGLAAPGNPWPVPERGVVCRDTPPPAAGLAEPAVAFYLRDGEIVAVQVFGTGAATLPPSDDHAWLIPP